MTNSTVAYRSYHVADPENLLLADGSLAPSGIARLARQLSHYPYFVILKGASDASEPESAQIMSISAALVAASGGEGADNVSVTQVKIASNASVENERFTRYSRTSAGLNLHTDSAYARRPHSLLGFQCVNPAVSGGSTLLLTVDDLIDALDGDTLERLAEPVYHLGGGARAILADLSGSPTITYYAAQLGKGAVKPLDDASRLAVEQLDNALQSAANAFVFDMEAGDIVLLNNRRVLHGRTAFGDDSERLLYRCRAHVAFRRLANNAPGKEQPGNSTGIPAATNSAELQMANGQFDAAVMSLLNQLEHDPQDAQAMLRLSATLQKLGRVSAAQHYLQSAAAVRPFRQSKVLKPGKPTLLRLRGLQHATYTLTKRAGRYSPKLSGGHFSTQDLLPQQDFNVIRHDIFDQTVLERSVTPRFDLILNTIACADRMEPELHLAQQFVAHHACPVINAPHRVLQTTRQENARRLPALDGVDFPLTQRVRYESGNVSAVLAAAEQLGLSFPYIIRPANTHTGSGVKLVRSYAQLSSYLDTAQSGMDYYLIDYVPYESSNGLFNKSRVFCIDGTFYPIANLHHCRWNVHSDDRYSVMDGSRQLQELERGFLEDLPGFLGDENVRRLDQVYQLIGLDFFGIDFVRRGNDSLLLFECNAAMRHNFDHVAAFPYTRPYLERASEAFRQMVQARAAGSND